MRRHARMIAALLILSTALRAGVVDAPPPVADPSINRANLQAAIDRAGSDGRGLVRFGPFTWTIDGPLFLDRSPHSFASVGLQGVDAGLSVLKMRQGLGYDCIVAGLDRRPRFQGHPEGVALSPDHFVTTTGLLDSSASGRWAFRTKKDARIAQHGGHLDQGRGDWYGATRKLTIDSAISFPDVASTQSAALYGMDGVAPLSLRIVNYRLYLTVRTVGPDPTDPESVTARNWLSADVIRPGLDRISIQLDLDTPGMASAWVRVPGSDAAVPFKMDLHSGPPARAGERLIENLYSPFILGGIGISDGIPPTDLTYAGFNATADTLYVPGSNPQARRDGRPITDALTYFRANPGVVGYLPLTRAGEDVAKDRVLPVAGTWFNQPSPGESGAYVLDNAGHGTPFSGYTAGIVERLGLIAGDPYFGKGIATGFVSNGRYRDLDVQGGSQAIGSFPLGASYPSHTADCKLQGHDTPLFQFMTTTADAERIWLEGTYRAGVRIVRGDLAIRKLTSAHWGKPQFGIDARESGISLESVSFDAEGGGGLGTQVATVYVTPGTDGQPVSSLVTIAGLDDVYGGKDAVKILLGGPAKSDPRRGLVGTASIRARGVAMRTNPAAPSRSAVRTLVPDLWTDEGIQLGTIGQVPYLEFEGPPLLKPRPVNTTPAPAQVPVPSDPR